LSINETNLLIGEGFRPRTGLDSTKKKRSCKIKREKEMAIDGESAPRLRLRETAATNKSHKKAISRGGENGKSSRPVGQGRRVHRIWDSWKW